MTEVSILIARELLAMKMSSSFSLVMTEQTTRHVPYEGAWETFVFVEPDLIGRETQN